MNYHPLKCAYVLGHPVFPNSALLLLFPPATAWHGPPSPFRPVMSSRPSFPIPIHPSDVLPEASVQHHLPRADVFPAELWPPLLCSHPDGCANSLLRLRPRVPNVRVYMEPETLHSPQIPRSCCCWSRDHNQRWVGAPAGADTSTHGAKHNQIPEAAAVWLTGNGAILALSAPLLLRGSLPFPQVGLRLGVPPWPAVELGLRPQAPDSALCLGEGCGSLKPD